MRMLAIQELIIAAKRSSPELDRLHIEHLNKTIGFDKYLDEFNDLSLQGSREKYSSAIKILELLADRITLMNSGFPENQKLGKEYYISFKMLFIAETLFNLQLNNAALLAAQYVQKKAIKFYFLHLVFQASKIIYAVHHLSGNVKEEKKGISIFRKHLNYYSVERELEIEKNEILRYYNDSQSVSSRITEKCEQVIEKYSQYVDNIPSFFFHLFYYLIKHIKYTNDKNHLAVYDNAIKALKYFDDLPFDYLPGFLTYNYVIIVFYIQKAQYLKADNQIKECLGKVRPKSVSWHRIQENQILLNFHRGTYQRAHDIFYKSFSSKSFVSNLKLAQQRWQLYEVYIRLLLESKLVTHAEKRTNYNIHKFLNDLPRFSKDKRAMNIPLLIAQLLFLIIRRKYDAALDRISALEKYSTRYLRNDDTFRSNCFIKMLLLIPKHGFNRIAVERHAQKYLDKLSSSEIELIDQPFEIEIIPYEKLWEIILGNLSKKKHHQVRV